MGMSDELVEGELYEVQVKAKNHNGEGIGHVGETMVFIKNAKIRMGKTYKVKITSKTDSCAYAEPLVSFEQEQSNKYLIGNGTLLL